MLDALHECQSYLAFARWAVFAQLPLRFVPRQVVGTPLLLGKYSVERYTQHFTFAEYFKRVESTWTAYRVRLVMSDPPIRSISGVGGGRFSTLVQIQQLAYMLTLSMHAPSIRAPWRLEVNPWDSKTLTYHGWRADERRRTRPPMARARLSLLIWAAAAWEPVSNQSMLSMTTATVRVPGVIRAMTSSNSSV